MREIEEVLALDAENFLSSSAASELYSSSTIPISRPLLAIPAQGHIDLLTDSSSSSPALSLAPPPFLVSPQPSSSSAIVEEPPTPTLVVTTAIFPSRFAAASTAWNIPVWRIANGSLTCYTPILWDNSATDVSVVPSDPK